MSPKLNDKTTSSKAKLEWKTWSGYRVSILLREARIFSNYLGERYRLFRTSNNLSILDMLQLHIPMLCVVLHMHRPADSEILLQARSFGLIPFSCSFLGPIARIFNLNNFEQIETHSEKFECGIWIFSECFQICWNHFLKIDPAWPELLTWTQIIGGTAKR